MPDDSSLLLDGTRAIRPRRLPELSSEDAALRNLLCGRRTSIDGAALNFAPPPEAQAGAPWVTFGINGAAASLQVSWGSLRRACDDQPLEALSGSDAALLLEDKIAAHLDRFEEKTGLNIRLTGVGDAPCANGQPIGIVWSGGVFRLEVQTAAARALANAMPYRELPQADTMAIALHVEVGTFLLSARVLGTLRAGDAITPLESGSERLLAQGSLAAPAAWVAAGLEITGPFQKLEVGEHLGMASELEEPQADGMDDLDVRVSVRAGEALMTLGDLRKLGPGSVLPMRAPDGDAVDLVVNGKRVGRGRLVTIGEARAVEITDLFGDG